MTYVDLNPVRAKICGSLEDSAHTSARKSLDAIEQDRDQAEQPLAPMLGVRGFGVVAMKQCDHLVLVDHTARQIRRAWMRWCRGRRMRRSDHPGKRGLVTGPLPAALAGIGCSSAKPDIDSFAGSLAYGGGLHELVPFTPTTWVRTC